jgi:hypothetical protein
MLYDDQYLFLWHVNRNIAINQKSANSAGSFKDLTKNKEIPIVTFATHTF